MADCWRLPRSRMLMAAFTSRSNSVPHSQECQRSDKSFLRTCPQPEHTCEVKLWPTLISVRPAHAALTEHSCTKIPQSASNIDLFNPPFALAPLVRYFPFSSFLGFGFPVSLPVWIS